MKLLIDIGNTSAKIAVANGACINDFQRKNDTWQNILTSMKKQYDIQCCAISTVAGDDPKLCHALNALHITATWLTWQTPNPIKPQSHAPKGMGADRWAADIAAMALAPNNTILVIDAGTCLTYDLWNVKGEYVGGAISPGVALRLKAMHEHTALLPLLKPQDVTSLLGNDTSTALLAGATHGTRLEIEGFIRNILPNHPDLRIFITGGNHFNFAPDLLPLITQSNNLVLQGLNLI